MKKVLFALACVVLAGYLAYGVLTPAPAEAGGRISDVTVDRLNDPAPGFGVAAVCSLWVNDKDPLGTADYTTLNAPTGYHFERIDILCPTASGAETGTIRFWDSATDSVSCVLSGEITFGVASGYAGMAYSFPVRCHKASFTGISNTDDFQVIGYCKSGAAF